MVYNFDEHIERRDPVSVKWAMYPDDVLPLWVADMDFRSPPEVIAALQQRAAHGVFGYHFDAPGLREVLVERYRTRHGLNVTGDQFVFTPGIVATLNLITRTFHHPGEGVLVQTPIYPPFLTAPKNGGKQLQTAEMAVTVEGQRLRYEIDFDRFEAAITPETRMFILCNPYNPVGRVYTRAELEKLAEICLRHNLLVIADEIHCDLLHPGAQHISFASLSPEVAAHTITLSAPSKTFNIPGLACSFAVIENPALLRTFRDTAGAVGLHPNTFGYVGAEAAYRYGQPWLDELHAYLTINRDTLVQFVEERLPQIKVTVPEGTYLAWLDCRDLNLPESPYKYFLEHAKVAFSGGEAFGKAGEGFVRLNYGCTRATLLDALNRVHESLNQ
ncbi:MAG: putative C-S lyase [Chloroflexi bacterium]|uniref:MalY/PatB family protein n=1 Tax=Candidatus Flexifilum breve TaxID=3140694 RepID=UPI003136C9A1|nr:putative C-S lyase [Chloroflexota bacterium]